VRGADVTQTRPNNVGPYAAGQVVGDAADARFLLPVPPLPPDAETPGFASIHLFLIESRPASDPILPALGVVLGFGVFPTVLGDGAALALAAADIAQLVPTTAATVNVSLPATGAGAGYAGSLNLTAGLAGRRAVFVSAAAQAGLYFLPGSTMCAYLFISAAYAPLALSTFTLRPYWLVLRKGTL
jgi:hypothetical protein